MSNADLNSNERLTKLKGETDRIYKECEKQFPKTLGVLDDNLLKAEKVYYPVTALRDNDCHWYVIPVELTDEFHRLLNLEEEGESEFIEKFSEYMTGGDLNCVQLYICK